MDFPNIGSAVTSIVTSMDYCIYSSIQGKVILYEYDPDYDQETDEDFTVLKDEGKNKKPIRCLKLSVDKNYLYGLLDDNTSDPKTELEGASPTKIPGTDSRKASEE